jgi:DNA-binding IclR family transcriptional regulator
VGAGSLALLAFLGEAEIARAIAANSARLEAQPGFEPIALRQLVAETRAQGFSFNEGRIIPGMLAVGVPVFGLRSEVVAALSLAAISSRLEPERKATIVGALKREAQALRQRLDPVGTPRIGREIA